MDLTLNDLPKDVIERIGLTLLESFRFKDYLLFCGTSKYIRSILIKEERLLPVKYVRLHTRLTNAVDASRLLGVLQVIWNIVQEIDNMIHLRIRIERLSEPALRRFFLNDLDKRFDQRCSALLPYSKAIALRGPLHRCVARINGVCWRIKTKEIVQK